MSLLVPLVQWTFVGGALGLIAGFAHDRIGTNRPTPLGRSITTGLGLGLLGSGLLSLGRVVSPSLTPPWSGYAALDTAVPWLAPLTIRLVSLAGIMIVLLLVAVSLHRWTRGGERRRPAAIATAVAFGFVAAGVGPAQTLLTWALQGGLLGLFLAGTVVLIWQYDRALIPMMAAGAMLLWGAYAVATAAHPYAVPGELLAMITVLGISVFWTYTLQHRQNVALSTS